MAESTTFLGLRIYTGDAVCDVAVSRAAAAHLAEVPAADSRAKVRDASAARTSAATTDRRDSEVLLRRSV